VLVGGRETPNKLPPMAPSGGGEGQARPSPRTRTAHRLLLILLLAIFGSHASIGYPSTDMPPGYSPYLVGNLDGE